MRQLNWYRGSKVKDTINTKEGFKLEEGDKVFLGGVQLNLEIAKNPKEGLSKRTSLCHNCGMVFFFDGTAHITTKETKLPLDIIFITENRIVKIITAVPFGDQYMYPADTVIELNSGFCRDNNINVGDFIQIDKKRSEKQREEDLEAYMTEANYRVRYKKGGLVSHSVGGRLLKSLSKKINNVSTDLGIVTRREAPPEEIISKEDWIEMLKEKKTHDKINRELYKEGVDDAKQLVRDFKSRIMSEEGLNRAQSLNLNKNDLKKLQDLKLKYRLSMNSDQYLPKNNAILINSARDKRLSSPIIRHEIEHATQTFKDSDGRSYNLIDKSLNDITLLPNVDDIDVDLNQINFYKGSNAIVKNLQRNDEAQKYFREGSGGKERSTMLAEVQQWALDNKFIKHPYDIMEPAKIKEIHNNYKQLPKEQQFLRLFNIVEPTEKNYKLLADNFNKLLTVGTVAGTGIGLAETYKKGGKKKLKSTIIRREGLAETSKTDILFQSPGDRRIEKKFKNAPMARYQEGGEQDPKQETQESPLVNKSEGTYLLDEKGDVQMVMQGNERIFSRIHTRKILSLIKKIDDEKDPVKLEKLLENLGVLVADIILTHDTQEEEYTED
jgi:uncharacterized membrane protein (UPF0127 family)